MHANLISKDNYIWAKAHAGGAGRSAADTRGQEIEEETFEEETARKYSPTF